jgi:hypothetical protein
MAARYEKSVKTNHFTLVSSNREVIREKKKGEFLSKIRRSVPHHHTVSKSDTAFNSLFTV